MIKVADIEGLKNKYFHRVGTQFDNAILVAEKEFLIDAYTKADMVAMLEEIQLEIEKLDPFGDEWNDSLDACSNIIQQKINILKTESEKK